MNQRSNQQNSELNLFLCGRYGAAVCDFNPPPDLIHKRSPPPVLEFQIANMAESKFDEVSKEIHESSLRKLNLFDSLRGKDVKESSVPFWDIVVVTAVDKKQLLAYELQIDAKLSRGELPKGLIYKVVSDPPGPKIGNGGATLHAIEQLEKDLGSEFLSQCKILMLHAGGFSQRLPSASMLGKIFTAVPYGKYTIGYIDNPGTTENV